MEREGGGGRAGDRQTDENRDRETERVRDREGGGVERVKILFTDLVPISSSEETVTAT